MRQCKKQTQSCEFVHAICCAWHESAANLESWRGRILLMSREETESPRRPIRPTWSGVLSLLTALVAVGTVTLHVVGVASHRAYLQYWGIDVGVFPKSTDLVLINGYYGLVNQSALAFLGILAHVGWWTAAAIGVALSLFVLLSRWDAGSGAVAKWLAGYDGWIQRLVRCLAGTWLVAGAIPGLPMAWPAVMVVPDAVGAASGRAHAEREAVEFNKGCEKSKHMCVELRKGSQTLGSGFVLDGSPSYIAIFDAQLNRARVIPREAVELISGRAPVLPDSIAP